MGRNLHGAGSCAVCDGEGDEGAVHYGSRRVGLPAAGRAVPAGAGPAPTSQNVPRVQDIARLDSRRLGLEP